MISSPDIMNTKHIEYVTGKHEHILGTMFWRDGKRTDTNILIWLFNIRVMRVSSGQTASNSNRWHNDY